MAPKLAARSTPTKDNERYRKRDSCKDHLGAVVSHEFYPSRGSDHVHYDRRTAWYEQSSLKIHVQKVEEDESDHGREK